MPGKNIQNVKPEKIERKASPKGASGNVKTKTASDRRQRVTPKLDHPVKAIKRVTKNRKPPRKSGTEKNYIENTEEYKTIEVRNFDGDITQNMLAESGDFPELYGPSGVVLIPVDPYHMHVYWGIEARDIEAARNRFARKFDRLQTVLRVFDSTNAIFDDTRACSSFDIPVDLPAGKWYVHLLDPGRSYFVDLGIKTESGIFYPIVRSNIAETPRGCPQPEDAERCLFVLRNEASHATIPRHERTGQGGLLHRTSSDVTDSNETCFVPGISSLAIASDK
jgi:hypothetical protein